MFGLFEKKEQKEIRKVAYGEFNLYDKENYVVKHFIDRVRDTATVEYLLENIAGQKFLAVQAYGSAYADERNMTQNKNIAHTSSDVQVETGENFANAILKLGREEYEAYVLNFIFLTSEEEGEDEENVYLTKNLVPHDFKDFAV